jgi:hypothetical protein
MESLSENSARARAKQTKTLNFLRHKQLCVLAQLSGPSRAMISLCSAVPGGEKGAKEQTASINDPEIEIKTENRVENLVCCFAAQ